MADDPTNKETASGSAPPAAGGGVPGVGADHAAQAEQASPGDTYPLPQFNEPLPILPSDASSGEAALTGGGEGVLFGGLDEVTTVVDTLKAATGMGKDNLWAQPAPITDWIANRYHQYDLQTKQTQAAHPGWFITGNVGGGLLVPFGAGARTYGEFAKVGATSGAAVGFLSGDSLEDRAIKAGEYAVGGALLGPALKKVGDLAVKGFRFLKGSSEEAGARTVVDVEGGTPMSPTETAVDEMNYPELGGAPEQVTVGWTNPDMAGNRAPIMMEQPVAPPPASTATPAPASPAQEAAQDPFEAWRDQLEKGGGPSLDITLDNPASLALRQIRLGRLSTVEQARQLMQDKALSLTRKEVRPDMDLATSAKNVADLTGSDPATMIALGEAIAGNLKEADTGMAIFSALKAKSRQEISAIHAMNIDWATASPELLVTAKEAIHNHAILVQMDIDAATGVGRALRSRQLPDADTYINRVVNNEAEALPGKGVETTAEAAARVADEGVQPPAPPREVRPLPETPEEIRDFFELWGMLGGNPKLESAFMRGRLGLPASGLYLRQSFANFFTASILSAPKTIMLNVVGPSLVSGMRNISRTVGGMAAGVNPLLSAEERAAAREVAASAVPAAIQTLGEIQDVIRMGGLAFSQNRRIIGGGAGVPAEIGIANAPLTQGLLDAANVKGDWKYSLGNLINIWPRAFSRVNNGLDEMSTRMSYLGNVRLNAMVEASQKGLTGEDAQAFVTKALQESLDEAGVATDRAAMEAASRVTMMGTPGQEGSAVRTASNAINQLRSQVPELRYILPVFNIPANAIGYTMEHLPIANIPGVSEHLGFSRNVAALKGKLGPVAQAEAHGQVMLGGAILTAGLLWNKMGLLTGAGPQDPGDRKAWLLTHRPYSIRLNAIDVPEGEGVRAADGGVWVDYRKFDILGGLLSIPATISDATTYRRDDQEMSDLFWAGAGAMMQWGKDRAAFQNVAAIMGVGDDPTKDAGSVWDRLSRSTAQGMIPGSAILKTGTDLTDPYVRMKRSWEEYMKGAIPFLSKELEPQRNIFGEPLLRPNDTIGEAMFPVTSAPAGSWKDDPISDEIVRLYQKTGYGAGSASRALSYGHFDPRELTLEDGKTFYDAAERARMTTKVDGKTLREALGELIDSEQYAEANDGSTKFAKDSLDTESRPYLVAKVFEKFNKAIKQELGKRSPKARAAMTAASAKERDPAHLGDLSVEQLMANPDLYRIRGIDPDGYAAKVTGDDAQTLLEALE